MSVSHDLKDTHVYHVIVEYSGHYMNERAQSRYPLKSERFIYAGPFMKKSSAKGALTSFRNGYNMKRDPQNYADSYIEESELVWKRVKE